MGSTAARGGLENLDGMRLGGFQLLKIRFGHLDILPLRDFVALDEFTSIHSRDPHEFLNLDIPLVSVF